MNIHRGSHDDQEEDNKNKQDKIQGQNIFKRRRISWGYKDIKHDESENIRDISLKMRKLGDKWMQDI